MNKQPANRGLVNRRAFSNSLSNDLSEAFNSLHIQTKIPKSKLLDEAIKLLLEKYNDNRK